MFREDSMFQTLAVVPIFVNVGTAILPAIIAGAASAMALLFKPRELWGLIRRRPLVPLIATVLVAGGWAGAHWLWASPEDPDSPAVKKIDWVVVARQIIQKEQAAALAQAGPETVDVPISGPVVFRHGYSRTGHAGGPSPLNLRPVWSLQSDGTRDVGLVLSSPLVANGKVYCAASRMSISGRYLGMVFCVDAADGTLRWKLDKIDGKTIKPFFSSPALTSDGKYLLIGQGLHDDADSDLLCIKADTGALHWRIRTPLHIEGSPAIHGDMVVAGAGAIEDADHKPTGDGGFVLAARISDGQELWRYAVNDPESSPAIGIDGTVYIGSGFQGNAVLALRSDSEEDLKKKGVDRLLWRTKLPYPMTGAVTLVDDLVVLGGGNSDYINAAAHPAGVVAAVDAKNGNVRWLAQMPDSVLGPVAARDGKLICPAANGELIALNVVDGRAAWKQKLSSGAVGAAFAPGRVYAVSRDGYLTILDEKDGRELERHALNDPTKPGSGGLCFSSPIVARGCVFVGSETGGLRCFAGRTTP